MTSKLLYYSSPLCGPCRALAPVVDAVKAELGDSVEVQKIDATILSDAEIAAARIKSLPTLVLLYADKEVRRHTGILSKQALLDFIHQE